MARDQIVDRYEKRKDKRRLRDLGRRSLTSEQIEAEEQAIAEAADERSRNPDKYRIKGGDDVGRNDPCPCGSGKKYKKCCGAAK